jgi:hypothetical protein
MKPEEQSAIIKEVEKGTVRIVLVRNGYVLKTIAGQYVFKTVVEVATAVEDFYAGRLK